MLTSTPPFALTLDTGLVVGLTVLITAAPLLPVVLAACALVGIAVLTVVAWFNRCRAAAPVGVFCVVCLGLTLSGVRLSQLVLAVGLVVYAIVVRRTRWLHGTSTWATRGSFSVAVRVLTAGCGLLAAAAVWAWYVLQQPNIEDIVETFVPAVPLGLLVPGGLAFSMVNAAVEEGAYRGVIQHSLESTLGPGTAALVLQATAFGALHIQGFPRGWMGVGLATVFGLMMGSIKRRSGGILAPWMAHVFTDVVIVAIVIAVGWPSMALHRTAVDLSLFGRG